MVSISVRQNQAAAPDQNAIVSPAHHYRVSGPNPALGWVGGSGCHDAAGRRLFLPDGSPDPDTPGAYRYRHDPDTCDPTAPETDPANPRYEPPHLRHQPGDHWEIGGKPYDADGPGPYGTPGWYQDQRTGRHRRGELPDPLPAEQDRPSPSPRGRRRLGTEADEPHRFDRLREDAWDRWLIDSTPLAAAHHTPSRRRSAMAREAGLGWALWISLARWLVALLAGSPHRRGERRSRSLSRAGSLVRSRSEDTGTRDSRPQQDRRRNRACRARRGPSTGPRGAAAMARAVAGARRARAGVAAWA